MKIIFTFVFILVTFVNADYLYIKTNECVHNIEPFHHKGWCFQKRSNNKMICNKKIKYSNFINGFYLDGKCKMYDELQETGMTYSQLQFQEALLANFYGFFISFLFGFAYLLQGRR